MKKFLMLALLLTAINLSASAEQPAAEEYRQMFRSGNFYVEYKIFLPNKITVGGIVQKRISSPAFTLAGQNGNRMQRIVIDKMQSGIWNYYSDWTSISSLYKNAASNYKRTNLSYADSQNRSGFSLLKDLVGVKDKKNYPDALFQDGKYYRFRRVQEFLDKTKIYGDDGTVYAKVLTQEDLNSPTLNQDDEWDYIRSDLALPDELAVFCWDEPFRDNFTSAPVYNGSSTLTVDDKEYDCDQYVLDIKTLTGAVLAQDVYNMLYDGGKLVRVQKYLIHDGKEELVLEVEIKNISSTVPADAFTIGRKIKVYAAENGDMQDLIEQPVLVETLGGN